MQSRGVGGPLMSPLCSRTTTRETHSVTRFVTGWQLHHHCRPRKADKGMVGCQRPIQSSLLSADFSSTDWIRQFYEGAVLSTQFIVPFNRKVCSKLLESVPSQIPQSPYLLCRSCAWLNLLSRRIWTSLNIDLITSSVRASSLSIWSQLFFASFG